MSIHSIVTDIEGTTSAITFVHDVLFPYAAEHLADFVRTHVGDAALEAQLDEVAKLSGKDRDDLEALIVQLLDWIAEDRKITPLKAIQGMIWRKGYENGDFTGHVYPDAHDNLCRWHERGIRLFVYSSGSVEAQKLLFGHSDFGDMTPLFSGYFDTRVGGKREAASYQKIAEALGGSPEQIVFLSDVVEELDAAREAGLKTLWVVRESPIPDSPKHEVVTNFDEVTEKLGFQGASEK